MFASRTTETFPLPSDPAIAITVRKLSWLQRQDARRQSVQASARDLMGMGGAEMLKQFKALETDEPKGAPVPAAPVDPLATHDMLTVLVCGIVAWGVPEPITKDTVSDLDPDDAECIARKILNLSLPKVATETDRKNDA